mgnify:CR=1 FL=1
MTSKTNHLWGGRFNEPTDEFVKIFGASVTFDKVLAFYDIQGSEAHATMLSEIGVLTKEELKQILDGLATIKDEINNGQFEWSIDLEDVHMNIEARLTEICGLPGKKLHTGRSRNDQVATDIRLYLRDQVQTINNEILRLLNALLDLAEGEKSTIMPGFTHLQAAQPVSFGHHLLAYFEMFKRDYERLEDSYKRINTMPLGAAALAGTSYPINRERTAELLGFDRICANSIDAVSDRDFTIEFCANASLIMMHLSRFSEELILWSSAQFNFVTLPDSFCTGSSIMPQKKNPDVAELARGKSGRLVGNLVSLLTLLKGLPMTYNRDLQEDKEPLFDSIDSVRATVRLTAAMLQHTSVNAEACAAAAADPALLATDLADWLVGQKVPFREAHHLVGEVVGLAEKLAKPLDRLTLKELQGVSRKFKAGALEVFELKQALAKRTATGSPGTKEVKKQLRRWAKRLG